MTRMHNALWRQINQVWQHYICDLKNRNRVWCRFQCDLIFLSLLMVHWPINGHHWQMGRLITKPTKCHVRPAKTRMSLGVRQVGSEFAVPMKKAWVLSYPLSAQQRLIRLGGGPGWSESSLDARHFVVFVVWQLKWVFSWPSKMSLLKVKNIADESSLIDVHFFDFNIKEIALNILLRMKSCSWYKTVSSIPTSDLMCVWKQNVFSNQELFEPLISTK